MISKERRFYVDIMAVHPEVTGSCNLIIVKQPDNSTVKFVVDCGLFQERQYSKNNEVLPFNPANIDFCLVTHNHVDHTGRLPFLVNKGKYKFKCVKSKEILIMHTFLCAGKKET